MGNLNVSAIHSLMLVPIDRLSRFAHVNAGVVLSFLKDPDDAHAVPGSIRVTVTSDSSEDGIFKKTISFKRISVDRQTTNLLNSYKISRLIAIYTDETGNRRVSGSPDYPLSFSYTSGEGVYTCKLEGEADTIDPFII